MYLCFSEIDDRVEPGSYFKCKVFCERPPFSVRLMNFSKLVHSGPKWLKFCQRTLIWIEWNKVLRMFILVFVFDLKKSPRFFVKKLLWGYFCKLLHHFADQLGQNFHRFVYDAYVGTHQVRILVYVNYQKYTLIC